MTNSAFIILAQVSQLGRPRCALYMNVYDMHPKFQMPRPDGTLSSPYRNLKPDFTQDMLFFYVLQKRKITFNCLTKLVSVVKIHYHTSRTPLHQVALVLLPPQKFVHPPCYYRLQKNMRSMWSLMTIFILEFVHIGECLKVERTHDVVICIYFQKAK